MKALACFICSTLLVFSAGVHADGTPRTITELRAHMDSIDDDLLVLLNERQRVAQEIGVIKRLDNQPIKDLAREKAIIARLQEEAKEGHFVLSYQQIADLWTTIMIISKAAQ